MVSFCNNIIAPGKIVGLIELDHMMKFVIHTTIVSDGFDGVSTPKHSLFMHVVLCDKGHIN